MASGIKVNDEVIKLFHDMKIPSASSPRIRLVVLKINQDLGEIILHKVYREPDLEGKDPFECMKACLEPQDCCYVIYDCHFLKSVSSKEELVFILWCDEDAKIQLKMQYAASKGNIKKVVKGVKHDFQVNCLGDIACRREFAEKLGEGVTSLECLDL